MKFVIALRWDPEHYQVVVIRCVGLDRKKQLTAPVDESRAEILRQLQEGQVFHVLYQDSCRWEVGPPLTLSARGKGFSIRALTPEAPTKKAANASNDEFPALPLF